MSEGTPQPGPLEDLLTPDEVCTWLRISKDLLYDLCQRKRLPYLRIGGRQLRFSRSELLEYVAERHVPIEPNDSPEKG